MKNEEFIRNKEYYKTSLNKILKFIIECNDKLDTICCGYCLKYINVNINSYIFIAPILELQF